MNSGLDTFSNHRSAEPVAWIHDTVAEGGFPHSEILGSKLVRCSPKAYRSVPRPSSPLSAKASQMLLRHLIALMIGVRREATADRLSLTPYHGHDKDRQPALFKPAALCLPNAPRPAAFATARAHSLFTMSDIRSEPRSGVASLRSSLIGTTLRPLPRSAGEGGGAGRDLEPTNLMLAKHALSQLSYCRGAPLGSRDSHLISGGAWDDSNVRPHPYQGCALTT